MNGINLQYINVGDNRYAINTLNPIEGLEWGNNAMIQFGPVLGHIFQVCPAEQLAALFADALAGGIKNMDGFILTVQPVLGVALSGLATLDGTKIFVMQEKALSRCYTPENEPLSNQAVFNRWFKEHPGDMHLLSWKAIFMLVKDFFPSMPATKTSGNPSSQVPHQA